jgi:hypothetical protein
MMITTFMAAFAFGYCAMDLTIKIYQGLKK